MASTKIFILRHAETDKNTLKKARSSRELHATTETDVVATPASEAPDPMNSSLMFAKNCRLNNRGQIQANVIGDYFNSIDHRVSAIYSSPLLRAVETADILIKRLGTGSDISFDVDDRLFCGRRDKSTDVVDLASDLQELVTDLVSEHKGSDVILVTHNHIFNILHTLFVAKTDTGTDPRKYKVENCGISCLDFTDHGVKVVYWGKRVKVTYDLV